MKLLILNGPNLNMLGIREPEIYGKQNYAALCAFVQAAADEAGVTCEIFQSNHEGVLVDKIQEAMDTLMQGRTSFIIAHRLSTIQNADLILVVQNGTVSEMGTHDTLMKSGGFYSTLYNSQFA